MYDKLVAYSAGNNYDFEIHTYTNSMKLYSSDKKFDIAILDINMPHINGIELGKCLRDNNPDIELIYITSHSEYLDEAMNINSARFFQKPLDLKRFYAGLDSIIERIYEKQIDVFVKDIGKMVKINIDHIIYVEIEQTGHRNTKVITTYGEFISSNKMEFWEERLLKFSFIRTHKSYIVNMDYVTEYRYNSFELEKTYEVPISRAYQVAVRSRFVKYANCE